MHKQSTRSKMFAPRKEAIVEIIKCKCEQRKI